MRVNIGDTVFGGDGRPGVVTARDAKSKQVTVQRQGQAADTMRKTGFINGLPKESRVKFNEIMREAQGVEDKRERVAFLNEKMNTLSEDPRNHILVKYVTAEIAHIMNTEGIQPNEYRVEEFNLR